MEAKSKNSESDGPSEKKQRDFIWKKDMNNWHHKRQEEIRKKYGDQIRKLEGNDPSSIIYFFFASLSHWMMAVLITYMIGNNSYWLIALAGWIIGGYWAVAAGLAMHEAAHQLVFKGRWPSMFAGIIAQAPLFFPAYKTFQDYHLPHHSYVTIEPDEYNVKEVQERDPQKKPIYDLDLPTEFEAWLFSSNPLTRVLFLISQVALYSIRPMYLSPRDLKTEDFVGVLTQGIYIWSACYAADSIGPLIYLFCSAVLGSGLHVSAIHFIAEHYILTEVSLYSDNLQEAQDTYSYYGPINYVLYNGGYHVEHHDFPRVSWKNLPQVRKIATDFYDTIPHHTSYIEVMFRFIFNHPGLWNRVKRIDRFMK